MLEENRTYTVQEIEEIFDKAQIKVLADLENSFKSDSNDALMNIAFTLQNVMVLKELKSKLFNKEV